MLESFTGTSGASARARLSSFGLTSDATSVYLLGATVLKVSPPTFPNVIRDMTKKAKQAREILGDELGRVIPRPLGEWDMDGVSCALFEELSPISSTRIKRIVQLNRIKSAVLRWLREVVKIDRGVNCQAETCLRALSECPYRSFQFPAESALARLTAGDFVARSTVMHSDLWIGNILLDPLGTREFVVIDWRGSSVNGFPIFDLVKFAASARLSRSILRAELVAHAKLLGCDLQDTRSYLLAALGHVWLSLDQFPPDRFAAMAAESLQTLEFALDG